MQYHNAYFHLLAFTHKEICTATEVPYQLMYGQKSLLTAFKEKKVCFYYHNSYLKFGVKAVISDKFCKHLLVLV